MTSQCLHWHRRVDVWFTLSIQLEINLSALSMLWGRLFGGIWIVVFSHKVFSLTALFFLVFASLGGNPAASSWFICAARHSCSAVSFFSKCGSCLGQILSNCSGFWLAVGYLPLWWWLVPVLGEYCDLSQIFQPFCTVVMCLFFLPYILPVLFGFSFVVTVLGVHFGSTLLGIHRAFIFITSGSPVCLLSLCVLSLNAVSLSLAVSLASDRVRTFYFFQ